MVLDILGSLLTLRVQSSPRAEHNPSEDEITEVELLDKVSTYFSWSNLVNGQDTQHSGRDYFLIKGVLHLI